MNSVAPNPAIRISGYNAANDPTNIGTQTFSIIKEGQETHQLSGSFNWVRGKHDVKLGWDVRRLRTIGNDWAGSNGFYYFSRAQTADPARLSPCDRNVIW